MKNIIRITTPLAKNDRLALKAGDDILLTGTIYTARDAAHRRFLDLIDKGEPLPLPLENQILYYCGPTPAAPGRCIGSAGPTTSSRMDSYAPAILRNAGLAAMIGKGDRSDELIEAMVETNAVYFAAIGGAGALISSCIKSAEIICYEDLGPEAVYKFEVVDMALIAAIDTSGRNLYKMGPQEYLHHIAQKTG